MWEYVCSYLANSSFQSSPIYAETRLPAAPAGRRWAVAGYLPSGAALSRRCVPPAPAGVHRCPRAAWRNHAPQPLAMRIFPPQYSTAGPGWCSAADLCDCTASKCLEGPPPPLTWTNLQKTTRVFNHVAAADVSRPSLFKFNDVWTTKTYWDIPDLPANLFRERVTR